MNYIIKSRPKMYINFDCIELSECFHSNNSKLNGYIYHYLRIVTNYLKISIPKAFLFFRSTFIYTLRKLKNWNNRLFGNKIMRQNSTSMFHKMWIKNICSKVHKRSAEYNLRFCICSSSKE